jgi:hypothetical protein
MRSGFYWLVARSDGTPYIAYCDMMTEGGGWTLVMRAIDTNFAYNDPLWSNELLENPDSFDFNTKGTRSKYRAYNEVPFDDLRTSDLDRVLGFTVKVTQPSARPSVTSMAARTRTTRFGVAATTSTLA